MKKKKSSHSSKRDLKKRGKNSSSHSIPSARPPRVPKGTPASVHPLEAKILQALRKEALSFSGVVNFLNVHSKEHALCKKILTRLERQGALVRVRGDHYAVPKAADLFTGILQIHATGAAHVLSEQGKEPDLYISVENTATALHGDRVVARLIQDRRSGRHVSSARNVRREGEVIRVLERSNKPIIGTFQHSENFSYLIADDPRFIHNLYLGGDTLGAKVGDKVVAVLERWENRHNAPEGKLLEVLGAPKDPAVAMLSIIRKHQLPVEFPTDVLREAAHYASTLDPKDLLGREDLRGRPIITIDPEDARDFDDAIEVQATSSGWDVSVHIADVAHYVLPGTALDEEARVRGNSVYLVDRVIPMLPEHLSNGLCSLRPQEDRLAFSVFASMDHEGKVEHVRFARTVIRSIARLSYKEALVLLQHPPQDALAERVHTAWACSSVLRQRRFKQGALDLEMPEVKVWLDEKGVPIKLERIENDISHQLIEELMLLANELVARHLTHTQQPNLYRVHEKPDASKLEEYRELVASYGVKTGDLAHRSELQKFLNGLKGKAFESALKIGLLKSLKRARYTPDPLGHFGLQKKDYTHFTSPIRRYADLITHRALAKQLGLAGVGPSSRDLAKLGDHISLTERTAGDAEKESVRLKKLDYFEAQQNPKKQTRFQAQVVEARNYGLFIELPEAMISGLIPIATIDDDFYLFDPLTARLIGRRKKKIYRAGDLLQVVVEKVDRWKQQVDFRIVR
ncbi:MAG: ribonuclease R [Chthoniobacterales bacterium]